MVNEQMEQNQFAIDTTTGSYVVVIRMMVGIRLSLFNSQNADMAGAQAEPEFKPGDELIGVFGIDDLFLNKLEEFCATLAPGYAGVGSATSTIPWLAISACPDGDVELHLITAPTEIAAAQQVIAHNTKKRSGNEYRGLFSLEPEILTAMKKFLRDRQEFDIKIM